MVDPATPSRSSSHFQALVLFAIPFFACFVLSEKHLSAEHYLILAKDIAEIQGSVPDQLQYRPLVPYADFGEGTQSWYCPGESTRMRRFLGENARIVVETKAPTRSLTGHIYLPDAKNSKLIRFKVEIDTAKRLVSKEQYYSALEDYYGFLIDARVPGANWYASRQREAQRMQGKQLNAKEVARPRFRVDQGFGPFSGTRAIQENLQLQRELVLRDTTEAIWDVNDIEGITIKEMKWKELLKGTEPDIDSLAKLIPHDQHVVFLDDFKDLLAILSETDQLLMPTVGAFSTTAIDEQTLPRYFQQLNLDLAKMSMQPFAASISGIGITGSDPYSELGTDVGVVTEFRDEESAKSFADFVLFDAVDRELIEKIEGIEDSGWFANPTRRTSIYLNRKGNRVWLSNSNFQIRKLKRCSDAKIKCIDSLDEYRYFRDRYKRDKDETAFVFMSDAAIRRWCSPRWRIGQSRRRRAMASLRELQAKNLLKAAQLDQNGSLDISVSKSEFLGKLSLNYHGVASEKYGTLAFMTPISELGVAKVTKQEKEAYERWRDSYQRNWSNNFDPIAIQIKISPKSISSDISVVPLIMNSQFRELGGGVPFASTSGSRHLNSLFHIAFSPNQDEKNWLSPYTNNLDLAEVYVDEDLDFWKDFTDQDDAEKYFQENVNRVPIALELTFKEAKHAKAFLDLGKALMASLFAEQESYDYNGVTIWKSTVPEDMIGTKPIQLYRYLDGKVLAVSFSEKVLKNSIDRKIEKGAANYKDDPKLRKWMGKNLALQANENMFRVLEMFAANHLQTQMQQEVWKHSPLLREWKMLVPDADPLITHMRFWNQKFVCPGGGQIRWDDAMFSISSTEFGSAADPNIPMGSPFPWSNIQEFDAGATVNDGGLRAKMKIIRK